MLTDVVVIGAGPAGVLAALRAAELGARTALVASGEFGGMAANDGPVPVRVLAHAAQLLRDARQLGRYGVAVSEPALDYPRQLAWVSEVVEGVRAHSALRPEIDSLGVTPHEQAGATRFADDLAQIPLSFPTYAGVLVLVATSAARELNLDVGWQAHQLDHPS